MKMRLKRKVTAAEQAENEYMYDEMSLGVGAIESKVRAEQAQQIRPDKELTRWFYYWYLAFRR